MVTPNTYYGPLSADQRRMLFGRGIGKGFIDFGLTGDAAILRTLQRLGETPSRKLLTRAVRAGANVIVRAARAELSASGIGDTGMMAKSLGVRVRVYPHSATVVGIIGARTGSRYKYRSRLLHLLEFAHRQFAWGVDLQKMSKPHPFMAPAWHSKRGEAMDITMGALRQGVRQEAAKMGVTFG